MTKIPPHQIRNIALVGHEGSGKTTLIEGLLLEAGVITRAGTIKEKNTVSDFSPGEKDAGKSFYCTTLSFTHKGYSYNILDVPGAPLAIADVLTALRSTECAFICVHASSGVKVHTRNVWKEAEQLGLPRFFVVTAMNSENIDFQKTIETIQKDFGNKAIPLYLPNSSEASFKEVLSTFEIEDNASKERVKFNKQITEAIVEADDDLMEKYLEGEKIDSEILRKTFVRAILEGRIFPILVTAAEARIGLKELLKTMEELVPSSESIKRFLYKGEEKNDITYEHGFVGIVYKTESDEFVTRITYIRILSGSISSNSTFFNTRSGKNEKVGNIFKVCGKDQKNIEEAGAGEIIAITKIEDLQAGDTICSSKSDLKLQDIKFPVPMVSLAIKPLSSKDEQKIGQAIKDLAGGEKTFNIHTDIQTGDLVISGMSTLHLTIMLKKLKRRYKIEVEKYTPKIPYKETITKSAKYVEYLHKKQSGGAGQFAKVFIDLEPLEHGEGYQFVDKIVGGVIDGSLRPSVDKGIKAVMDKGVIAGYPVADVRVTLVDGKMHPVDSKDIAFQIAGREVFKKAFKMCSPVMLEPIVKMDVHVPQVNIGDVIGDLNGRRGKISSSNNHGDEAVVEALVPLAEIQTYQANLKSMTGGEGTYSVEFDHYDVVPHPIQQKIISEHEKELEGK